MSDRLVHGFSAIAGAALTSHSGKVMKITGADSSKTLPTVTIVAAAGYVNAGEVPCGILVEGRASGLTVDVQNEGEHTEAIAGDTLTPGTHYELSYDSSGKLIPALAGMYVVAIFIGHKAVAANGYARVHVVKPYKLGLSAAGERLIGLSAAAEAGNAIAVTVAVTDGAGQAVTAAVRLRVTAFAAGNCALTETGAGAQVGPTSPANPNPVMVIDTDATGAATVTVTDSTGALAGTIGLIVEPLNVFGRAQYLTLTFA